MAQFITRWDPFREAVTLREAMDRLFEDSFVPSRQQVTQERTFRLPLDAYVTPEEIVIVANVPGLKPEDVEITLEGDTLTIKGERPRRWRTWTTCSRNAPTASSSAPSISTSRWTRTRLRRSTRTAC